MKIGQLIKKFDGAHYVTYLQNPPLIQIHLILT